jgi:CubicO group peptidase (beta-lactamase class C family)
MRWKTVALRSLLRALLLGGAIFGKATAAAHVVPDSASLDREVTRLMQAANVPGFALAVIDEGKIMHLRAYGQRDIGRGLPLTVDTVMYGASLTKGTFAYAVMGLVEEGRLDLDTPIADLLPKPLPDYEKYADLADEPRWRAITPRMLLSHTAGFPNFRFFTPRGFDENGKLTIEFDPGTRFAYSGEGINLLQFVIEAGMGIDATELMRQRVFERFGMTRTDVVWRDAFADNFAMEYDSANASLGHKQRRGMRAAGSMDTTLRDYAAYLAGLIRGEGLGRAARAELFRSQIAIDSVQQFPTLSTDTTTDNRGIALASGLGWIVYDSPQGRAFFKGGHDDGTRNLALCLESSRRCILMLSNGANGDHIFNEMIDRVLGPTCFPWFWSGKIPYDRQVLQAPDARAFPQGASTRRPATCHPTCGNCPVDAAVAPGVVR